jgi:hypothetical protein
MLSGDAGEAPSKAAGPMYVDAFLQTAARGFGLDAEHRWSHDEERRVQCGEL